MDDAPPPDDVPLVDGGLMLVPEETAGADTTGPGEAVLGSDVGAVGPVGDAVLWAVLWATPADDAVPPLATPEPAPNAGALEMAPAAALLEASSDKKPCGFGAWILMIAWPTLAPELTDRNPTPAGEGMTIPMPAAKRSMR